MQKSAGAREQFKVCVAGFERAGVWLAFVGVRRQALARDADRCVTLSWQARQSGKLYASVPATIVARARRATRHVAATCWPALSTVCPSNLIVFVDKPLCPFRLMEATPTRTQQKVAAFGNATRGARRESGRRARIANRTKAQQVGPNSIGLTVIAGHWNNTRISSLRIERQAESSSAKSPLPVHVLAS